MDNLETLRKIDNIDNQILVLLKKRFEILSNVKNIKNIKNIKNEVNLNILDTKREEKIFKNIYDKFQEYYIYFKPIYEIIIKESNIYQKGKLGLSSV